MLDDTARFGAEAMQSDATRSGLANRVDPPDAPRRTDPPNDAPARLVREHEAQPRHRWYCLQHRPIEGAQARLALRRHGFSTEDVHWPRAIVRRHWRSDDVLEPLFPGYLFARFDIRVFDWGSLKRDVRGIEEVVGVRWTGKPIPVQVGAVERLIREAGGVTGLLDFTGDAEAEKQLPARLAPDTPVTFLDDALFAQPGLLRADQGKERVTVLMTWFGQQREVQARRSQVKQLQQ